MTKKYIAHGRKTLEIASSYGWFPGARYTNLRDIRHTSFEDLGFLDIDWKKYDFDRHLIATKNTTPYVTVARDVLSLDMLEQVLEEAELLSQYSQKVVIVPKASEMAERIEELVPKKFLLEYSCPTKYGATEIDPSHFQRPVHILGGRPDVQRRLANLMEVFSFDCNRFTLDASFGYYFNGSKFVLYNGRDYDYCLRRSFEGINQLWQDYK